MSMVRPGFAYIQIRYPINILPLDFGTKRQNEQARHSGFLQSIFSLVAADGLADRPERPPHHRHQSK